jgi:hypothetical protein
MPNVDHGICALATIERDNGALKKVKPCRGTVRGRAGRAFCLFTLLSNAENKVNRSHLRVINIR